MSAEQVIVKLLADGGETKPSSAISSQLGPTGVNIGQVIAEINKQTSNYKGMKVPATVIVDKKTRTFELEIGIPPASALIKKEAGIAKGSGTPQNNDGGNITYEQVISIAKSKRPDLIAASLKTATLEILGTMNSMGVTCEGVDAKEFQAKVKAGEFDDTLSKHDN